MIEFVYIICLILINFIFLPYIWKKFARMASLDEMCENYRKQHVIPQAESLIRFVYNEKNDCNITATSCISNQDCLLACISSNNRFVCHRSSLLCVPENITHETKYGISKFEENKKVKTKCFPNKGVMAVLQEDPELVSTSWNCISIFSHLIDDQGNKRKGVCDGVDSKFNINLKAHFPRIEDCKCSKDRTLITFSGRKFGDIRSSNDIPRCVYYEYLYTT